jgi:ankyrin repeat protein
MFWSRLWRISLPVGLLILLVTRLLIWQQQTDGYDRAQSRRLLLDISQHDIAGIQDALRHGADPNYAPPLSRSPQDILLLRLHTLCFWNRGIREGAQREIVACSETPLALAVRDGQENIVRYLLSHGAKADYPVQEGMTPLMVAANRTDPESAVPERIARLLLAAGADPNARAFTYPGSSPHTPLRMATFSANPRPMVRLLLKAGAKVQDTETRSQLVRLKIHSVDTTK